MRVDIQMPDPDIVADVRRALWADEQITVTEGAALRADVRLIHSSMLPRSMSALRDLTNYDGAVIVTSAPRDPQVLAGYLAAGVNGYHFAEESWARLVDVIWQVHAGGYRHDPYVIWHLLEHYRLLRQQSTGTDGFGPRLH